MESQFWCGLELEASQMANLDRFFADFYGNGGWRLEAFSKVASQDHDAGELDEGEEICGMVLIADNHAAEVLEPGVHALDLPASFVAPQRQPVLGFAERFAVGRDEDPAARGTWQTDPHHGGTRYLWAGYRYQPPQMGFWVDPPGAAGLGIYGAASGTNRLGQYYCWNRTYDLNLGRWTTPDPVATPWWNLGDYTRGMPTRPTDPNGLFSVRIVETLDGQESTNTEDKLSDAMKKLTGGNVDTESNADEDDIVEGLSQTGEDDVFVYYGHSADTDGDGKQDTLMEHDSLVGCVAGGVAIGGLLGGIIGAALSANDPIDKDDFAKAAKKAKGTVIIFGCKGCDLKFENAKCVICYEEKPTLRKAAADMEAMAKVIDDLKAGQCKTWSQIANAATQEGGRNVKAVLEGDAATLKPSDGCKNVKVCK